MMCVDGYKLLTVRIQWELLISILLINFGVSFSSSQLDKDILRQGNWILRNIELGVGRKTT